MRCGWNLEEIADESRYLDSVFIFKIIVKWKFLRHIFLSERKFRAFGAKDRAGKAILIISYYRAQGINKENLKNLLWNVVDNESRVVERMVGRYLGACFAPL